MPGRACSPHPKPGKECAQCSVSGEGSHENAPARKKAEGVILGRPKGRKSTYTKLTGREKEIKQYLDKKVSHSAIGRIMGVHRFTVSTFVKSITFTKV